jgi:hypothetical protein
MDFFPYLPLESFRKIACKPPRIPWGRKIMTMIRMVP